MKPSHNDRNSDLVPSRSTRTLGLLLLAGALTACGGGGGGGDTETRYSVDATAGPGGIITPDQANGGSPLEVAEGETLSYTVTPDTGYSIDAVTGCGGSLSGNSYTTAPITADCTITASFVINRYTVSATAGANGDISPAATDVDHGATASFAVTPETGYTIDSVSGCGGSLSGDSYTTGPVTADCTVTASFIPSVAQPSLGYQAIKTFHFSWTDASGASHYRLLEDPDGSSGYTQIGADIPPGTQVFDHAVNLHQRVNARYVLQTCFQSLCNDSAPVQVDPTAMAGAIGYFKASNADMKDGFGTAVAISGDGNTLAVGVPNEDSGIGGINTPGAEDDNSQYGSGAVYVFVRDADGNWAQQAFVKASTPQGVTTTDDGSWQSDHFGLSVSLSDDGNTLAVGADGEDSGIGGINTPGAEDDNSLYTSGAAYVFTRAGTEWAQQAYVKAATPIKGAGFGTSVSLDSSGTRLAVGAPSLPGYQGSGTGQVYIFDFDGSNWSQQQIVEAGNTDDFDRFGQAVALSGDGQTLAVGAHEEDSSASGVNPGAAGEADNSLNNAGAAYVFIHDNGTGAWTQQAYLKASNPDAEDAFGHVVALNADGNTLVVTASHEDSAGVGIDSALQNDNSASNAGAAYVFVRDAGTGEWTQQSYLKASNTEAGDYFGGPSDPPSPSTIGLSADGNTLVIGAMGEDSLLSGLQTDQADNQGNNNGTAYVFVRSGTSWSQKAYLKASNAGGWLGKDSAISADGGAIVVGARAEASNATGIGGDASDTSAPLAGAVYLY